MNTGMITEEIRNWVRAELWDQVPVSISVIDRQFRIVEANRMFAQTYGNWQDRPCYSVYKERTEHCEQCAADMTFSDGQVRVREEKGVFRDGQQTYYVVQMVPLVRPDGTIPYIIEASTDITATKKLEREKRDAERLAAVGQTVAGPAHGIKNVLMGLGGGRRRAHLPGLADARGEHLPDHDVREGVPRVRQGENAEGTAGRSQPHRKEGGGAVPGHGQDRGHRASGGPRGGRPLCVDGRGGRAHVTGQSGVQCPGCLRDQRQGQPSRDAFHARRAR